MKNVLITAIGSFSADIVIKNLKAAGMSVVGCDIYPGEWIADSSNVSAFYQVPYATDEAAYVKAVFSICQKEEIDGLVVLTDVEVDVWNQYRAELLEKGITLCLSSEETIALCRDKEKLHDYFMEKGLNFTIPTQRLKEAKLEELTFPAVVKPYNGRSSQGLRYVNHKAEIAEMQKDESASDYIIQPFVKGPIITADIVRQAETNRLVVICRKELLRTQNGAGTSVLVFHSKELEQICRNAAEALDIRGCVNFEFIESEDGRYYMLECNPRFSGGVEFSCMAGYDCVINHVRCFDGNEMDPAEEITSMYIARKYEEYITKINEV